MRKFSVFAVSVTFALALFSVCANRVQEDRRYEIKAQSAGNFIVQQASTCVSQSKAYMAVWEYARVSEIDFEKAAAEMLGPETRQNKAMMVEHKGMIKGFLEELKDPSSRFESTYERLTELHAIYVKLHDLAMDPSDEMRKHMETVDKLFDQILEKKREFDATFVM